MLGLLVIASSLPATFLPNVKHSLTGRVINTESNEPLEYATISIYSPDDVLVEGTVTDVEGQFALQLRAGSYRVKVEFLGFETLEQLIDLQQPLDLGVLSLGASGLELEAVEVRAERSQMSLQLDKKVFDIGQDALSRGGSANEVLEQLPSVNVSADGAVSLRGNSGVRVLINGRPSALANNNSLEAIPAESIEKVEIITNPSARFEAAGTAGIINIILKQERALGYGGTLSLSTGYPGDHRANLNLNLRAKRFNAFANGGYRYSNYRGRGDLQRRSSLDVPLANLDQQIDMDRNDNNYYAYLGLDYNFSETSVLTATYSLYDVINDDLTRTDLNYFDQLGTPSRDWVQWLDYLEPGRYQQLDLIYAKDFAREGEKFTFYFKNDLWEETETEATSIDQLIPSMERILNYRTQTVESSRDHLLQADYERPLGENAKIEVGLRGETRVISADYLAENFANNEWATLAGFDNELDYFERIGSAYFQYNYRKNKWGLQLGLRNEYTYIRVENSAEGMQDFDKNYNRLFPSASASFRASDASSFQLSYSRRIRRPSFWQLNPFRGISDASFLFVGNPDMDPAYTDRLEFNFVQRWEKLTLNPALYASTTTDYFESVVEQVEDNLFGLETGTITRQMINARRENRFGIELNTNYRPSDALNLSADVNYYGYQRRGEFEDRSFDFDFATWSAGLRMQLELPAEFSFQSRLGYDAAVKDVQSVRRAQSYWTGALSKQWNNKFTVTLSTRSPRWSRSELFRPSFTQDEYFAWTGWRTSINFQYRFEKGAGSDSRRGRGSIR